MTNRHENPWPGGRRFAVSLCYDDGNADNLEHAIPDLEARGLCGSFYLTLNRRAVQKHTAQWRAAHERGHEMANHTWTHRCRADGYPERPAWLKHPLEEATEADMTDEIQRAAEWLDQHIAPDPDRSFAYPCGHTALGDPPDEAAYRRAVAVSHRFARVWTRRNAINDPATVDLTDIDSVYFTENTLDQFLEAVERTRTVGGWVCLGFHSIGGPSHNTEPEVHRALLDHLIESDAWVAPVRDVALHIEALRHKGDEAC